MGGRILERFTLVVRPRDHALLQRHDHGANGHLVFVEGRVRFVQRHGHVFDMVGMARVGQRQIECGPLHSGSFAPYNVATPRSGTEML